MAERDRTNGQRRPYLKKMCAEIESYNKVVVVGGGGVLELNVISN